MILASILSAMIAQTTPTPCALVRSPAMVVVQATPDPHLTQIAANYHAVVIVDVVVGPDGKATSTNIRQSSLRPDFDGDAISIAERSTYQPQIQNCVAIAAHVSVTVGYGVTIKPTAPPACAAPNREASVVNYVQASAPPEVKEPATALVEVTIGPNGKLINASIYKSTGYPRADRAAIEAARQSTYAPKFVDCQPATGLYLYRAEFTP